VTALALASAAAETRLDLSSSHAFEASNNPDLLPSGRARAAVTSTQSGAADLKVDSRRLDLSFHYNFDVETAMGERIDNHLRHQAVGVGQFEVLDDYLYLDARTLWNRVTLDQGGAVGAGARSGRSNQASSRTIQLSPYFAHSFGTAFDTELRYRYSNNVVDNSTIGHTSLNEQLFKVESGDVWTALKLIGALEHSKTEQSSESGNLERYTGRALGQLALERRFSLLGSLGLEQIDRGTLTDQPYQMIWSGGFLTRPGPRTELELTYGRRYGRPNLNGSLRYRVSPRLTLAAHYEETMETTQQTLGLTRYERASGLEPGLGLSAGQLYDPRTGLAVNVNDPGLGLSADVLLVKRLVATLIGTFERLTSITSLTREQRDGGGSLAASDLAQIGQTTAWKLTPTTGLTTYVSFQHLEGDGASNTVLGRVSLSNQLTRSATGTVGVSRVQRFSPNHQNEYGENVVFCSLTIRY